MEKEGWKKAEKWKSLESSGQNIFMCKIPTHDNQGVLVPGHHGKCKHDLNCHYTRLEMDKKTKNLSRDIFTYRRQFWFLLTRMVLERKKLSFPHKILLKKKSVDFFSIPARPKFRKTYSEGACISKVTPHVREAASAKRSYPLFNVYPVINVYIR